MKLTTVVMIQPSDPIALLSMIRQFNLACNHLSRLAFEEGLFRWLPLQKRAYRWLCSEFGLSGSVATVAVRKVAYAYRNKARRSTPATFKPLGGIPLHRHSYKLNGIVRFYGFSVPFLARPDIPLSGKHQAILLYRDGRFFIHQVIEAPEPEPFQAGGFLGIDLGVVNLAFDSEGESYTGGAVERRRRIFAHRRRNLQRKGTRSARRKLQRIRHRQARYQRDTNHCISKAIVSKAQRHSLGIALEDLGGIQGRITVRRKQRARHSNWAFFQLRAFIEYKAALAGVPVAIVNPAYTSRECPGCSYISKANRISQSLFSCQSCGFSAPADYVAALNIKARADGNQPMVASTYGG